jgi:hypothetical protein
LRAKKPVDLFSKIGYNPFITKGMDIMENEIAQFLANGGSITIYRTRRGRGFKPLTSSFGGNRLFLASRAVSASKEGGMLRMGTGLRKYGN